MFFISSESSPLPNTSKNLERNRRSHSTVESLTRVTTCQYNIKQHNQRSSKFTCDNLDCSIGGSGRGSFMSCIRPCTSSSLQWSELHSISSSSLMGSSLLDVGMSLSSCSLSETSWKDGSWRMKEQRKFYTILLATQFNLQSENVMISRMCFVCYSHIPLHFPLYLLREGWKILELGPNCKVWESHLVIKCKNALIKIIAKNHVYLCYVPYLPTITSHIYSAHASSFWQHSLAYSLF